MPDAKKHLDSPTEREYELYLTRERGLAAETESALLVGRKTVP